MAAVARAAAAVVFPSLVGALEGARALAPLPVVAALVPVLLGRLRVLPGLALRAGSGLFPLVAVSAGALELLAAVLGLGVGRAVVVVPPGAAAVAARAAARAGAVGARQAPPVVVAAERQRLHQEKGAETSADSFEGLGEIRAK